MMDEDAIIRLIHDDSIVILYGYYSDSKIYSMMFESVHNVFV